MLGHLIPAFPLFFRRDVKLSDYKLAMLDFMTVRTAVNYKPHNSLLNRIFLIMHDFQFGVAAFGASLQMPELHVYGKAFRNS